MSLTWRRAAPGPGRRGRHSRRERDPAAAPHGPGDGRRVTEPPGRGGAGLRTWRVKRATTRRPCPSCPPPLTRRLPLPLSPVRRRSGGGGQRGRRADGKRRALSPPAPPGGIAPLKRRSPTGKGGAAPPPGGCARRGPGGTAGTGGRAGPGRAENPRTKPRCAVPPRDGWNIISPNPRRFGKPGWESRAAAQPER